MTAIANILMRGLLEATENEPHLPLGMFWDQQGLPFDPALKSSYNPPPSNWKPPKRAPPPHTDPDDFDLRDFIASLPNPERRIAISFSETWFPAGQEEYEEVHGWENKEGEDLTLDEWDVGEGLNNATKAIDWLRNHGATDTGNDDWYSSEPVENYHDGHSRELSFHLKGYNNEELSEIYNAVVRPRRPHLPQ